MEKPDRSLTLTGRRPLPNRTRQWVALPNAEQAVTQRLPYPLALRRLRPPLIPIANLYYLLCYAWDVLPPRGAVPGAAAEESPTAALALLTHLLTLGLTQRQRRGFPVTFIPVETIGPHPRGQLLPGRLARLPQAAALGHVPSRHYQPTLDTPLHRVVVTALRRSLATPPGDLPPALRRAGRAALAPLTAVTSLTELCPATVTAAARTLRPADTTAHLLLRAAELLLLNLLPTTHRSDGPTSARTRFHDFRADEVQMGRVFEAFVRNFLRREQRAAAVSSDVLRWRGATATTASALPLLPVMRTDTTLTTPARRLVIDTKFYARPLAGSRFESARLLAPHLYQLLAYLRNQSAAPGQRVEGMLLYPASAASGDLFLDYQLEGFRVQVRTLDLAVPWPQIQQTLLALVAD